MLFIAKATFYIHTYIDVCIYMRLYIINIYYTENISKIFYYNFIYSEIFFLLNN